MTKLEVQNILSEAYQMSFLDTIEFLNENEADYKKSDYYKKNKIPLKSLYEKYFLYRQSKYGLEERVEQLVQNLDYDKVAEMLVDLLNTIQKNDKIVELFEKIVDKFNLTELLKNNEELKTILNDFKKLQ